MESAVTTVLEIGTPGDQAEVPEDVLRQAMTPCILNLGLRDARLRFEREYLRAQLALCGGRVSRLSKAVGMERTHLYRKLRELGLEFKDYAPVAPVPVVPATSDPTFETEMIANGFA